MRGAIVFAHYIGDIALQNDWQARHKCSQWYVMVCHCIVWTGCVCVALEYAGTLAPWKVAFLIAGHFACDKWKCTKPCPPSKWTPVYLDQAIHLAQLALVYLCQL